MLPKSGVGMAEAELDTAGCNPPNNGAFAVAGGAEAPNSDEPKAGVLAPKLNWPALVADEVGADEVAPKVSAGAGVAAGAGASAGAGAPKTIAGAEEVAAGVPNVKPPALPPREIAGAFRPSVADED